MKKQTGFTLIELLVTIIIMGIMASIALPAMTSFMERQRIKSALANYSSALVFARNEAIRQNVPVLACGANVSISGQLVGCANNTKSWSEGIFVYADVNNNGAYNASGDNPDRNIRVVNSPNAGQPESNRVIISMGVSPLSGTSPITNPLIQFLPNGQVVLNGVASANYITIGMVSENNSEYSAKALLSPTGRVVVCNKQTKSDNEGNKIAELCA